MKKKLIIGGSVTLLLVLFMMPLIIGMGAQKKIEQYFNKMNQYGQQFYDAFDVNVSLSDYQRGWFRSTAELSLILAPKTDDPSKVTTFNIGKMELNHGPFVRTESQWRFALAAFSETFDVTQLLELVFADQPFKLSDSAGTARMDGIIGFSGTVRGEYSVDDIRVEEDEVAHVISGLHGSFNLRKLSRLDYSLAIPSIRTEGPDAVINLDKLGFSVRFNDITRSFMPDQATYNIDSVVVYNDEQEAMKLSGLTANFATQNESDHLSAELTIKLDEYVGITPTHRLDKSEMTFVIKNLNKTIFTELAKQLVEIERSEMSASAKQFSYMAFAMQVPRLLEKGLSVELKKLQLAHKDGVISGAAKVTLNENIELNDFQNLERFLSKLDMSLSLKMPEAFTKKAMSFYLFNQLFDESMEMTDAEIGELLPRASVEADQRIAGWENKGLIAKEQDKHSVNFSYKAGDMLVNGQAVKLQDLFA